MMHTDELFEITQIAYRYGSMAWEQVETAVYADDIDMAIEDGEIAPANVDLIRDILEELRDRGVDTHDHIERLNEWLAKNEGREDDDALG